ncbi:MAG: MmgE/PrpD family protein [Jatrophihabitantaceae bacterium]
MTATEQLAGWAASLRLADVPDAARHAAARHLLDGIGTALAARREDVVRPAVTVAGALGGPEEATILGERRRLSAPAAAFANGALVHGLDFDDTHAGGLVHATAVVLPAALAVGQQTGACGADVLLAALIGYECVCRIAMASPHGFHARGLHATQVAGVFSAAAVTARLCGMSELATTQAFGIAGSSSGGLLEFLSTGASTKQLHPGSASLNGIIAARLAAAGATGPATVLEGPNGIYAALSQRPSDVNAITAGLGQTWEVTRITIKPYPSCQLMHVALDAAAAAAAAAGPIRPSEIVEVLAEVHPDSASVVCEPAATKVRPRTSYDAKFSLPWSVAALLVDGRLGVASYAQASIVRPEVAELAGRVRSRRTEGAGVAADAAGRVEIQLADGRRVEGTVECSAGAPLAPLDDDALLAKFLGNAGDTILARELAERVLNLAGEPDLSAVVELAARIIEECACP